MLSPAQQATRWLIVLAILLAVLYFLGDVLTPFILGAAIAYFLDPLADKIEEMGLSRILSVAIIMLSALFVFSLFIVIIVPTLIEQLNGLVTNLPNYFDALYEFVKIRFPSVFSGEGIIYDTFMSFKSSLKDVGLTVADSVIGSTLFILNSIFIMFFVPVVACYLLLDWDNMVATVDSWLPREHLPTIRKISKDINNVLASFVRGQLTVCLALGTFYSILLAIVGLNFGLIIGAIAGAVTFIPYLGALLGGGLAIGVALYQFWGEWIMVGSVVVIFVVGQVLEGNVITPRLVGKSVGLHPVWLLFALSAFAKLFGFIGMLVAVPVAAVIGVLGRFFIGKYKKSKLYLGHETKSGEEN